MPRSRPFLHPSRSANLPSGYQYESGAHSFMCPGSAHPAPIVALHGGPPYGGVSSSQPNVATMHLRAAVDSLMRRSVVPTRARRKYPRVNSSRGLRNPPSHARVRLHSTRQSPTRTPMTMIPRFSIALLLALAGCSPPLAPLPPPPQSVRDIAVVLPTNATGKELLVNNPGMLGRAIGEATTTVPEALASDLRQCWWTATSGSSRTPDMLPSCGFRSLVGISILRTTRPSPWILTASLVDPKSGRELWTARRTGWPVATPDARSSLDCSASAALAVARALIDGWQPSTTPSAGSAVPYR